jgi:hypothetical protein
MGLLYIFVIDFWLNSIVAKSYTWWFHHFMSTETCFLSQQYLPYLVGEAEEKVHQLAVVCEYQVCESGWWRRSGLQWLSWFLLSCVPSPAKKVMWKCPAVTGTCLFLLLHPFLLCVSLKFCSQVGTRLWACLLYGATLSSMWNTPLYLPLLMLCLKSILFSVK